MKSCSLLVLLAAAGIQGCGTAAEYEPRNGDIVFQTSRSAQSSAIQKVTGSKYSHMGIVYVTDGEPYVYEAVEPVRLTPLSEWVARGVGGQFVARRLADADVFLSDRALQRMLEVGRQFEGKHYDLYFEWSDERVYCSELVWKIYKRALDLEIGRLQTIAEFDLSDPVVRSRIEERFGGPPAQDETVISPAAMFSSDLLVTAYEQ
ncbi:MAG: YiiX family permuted papain-like enzyme [Gemmatimonadales bacterium]